MSDLEKASTSKLVLQNVPTQQEMEDIVAEVPLDVGEFPLEEHPRVRQNLCKFLSLLAQGTRYRDALKQASLTWPQVHQQDFNCPAFKELHRKVQLIQEAHLQKAREDEADRRAIEGVDEPVFYMGRKVGTKKVYSDTLLALQLRAGNPEKYAAPLAAEGGLGGSAVLNVQLNISRDPGEEE